MALTSRGRAVVRLMAFGSVSVVLFAGFSSVSSASSDVSVKAPSASSLSSSDSAVSYVRVIVAPGETLWTVAAAVAGSSSVAGVVDEIVRINHLSSSDVTAGTRLLVPIK